MSKRIEEFEESMKKHMSEDSKDSTVFCTQCGAEIPEHAKFCYNCGKERPEEEQHWQALDPRLPASQSEREDL